VKFETLTYSAHVTDYSVAASAPSILGRSLPEGGIAPAYLPPYLAAFLLRLAAYFQGTVNSLPRKEYPTELCLTVIDTALDGTTEPLQRVRMNRQLSRRLRWLIKRGRVERSGETRLATAEDEARCNLTPGQFNEYCIRSSRVSRIRIYSLGLSRRALRLRSILLFVLQGDRLCLGKASLCSAPLSPD